MKQESVRLDLIQATDDNQTSKKRKFLFFLSLHKEVLIKLSLPNVFSLLDSSCQQKY